MSRGARLRTDLHATGEITCLVSRIPGGAPKTAAPSASSVAWKTAFVPRKPKRRVNIPPRRHKQSNMTLSFKAVTHCRSRQSHELTRNCVSEGRDHTRFFAISSYSPAIVHHYRLPQPKFSSGRTSTPRNIIRDGRARSAVSYHHALLYHHQRLRAARRTCPRPFLGLLFTSQHFSVCQRVEE